jgi:ATP-dependent Clp protease ATP-binding subunit ClpX
LRQEPAAGKKLIAGPGVYICDECIDLCNEIIDEELTTPTQLDLDNLPRPRDIYAVLNDYVVSQEEAKRTLAVAVYNHYKRVRMGPGRRGRRAAEVEHPAARPHRLRQDAARADARADPQRAVRDRGRDRADRGRLRRRGRREHPLKLIQAADFDIKKAETGIIYIDEVDKIARKADNPSITRDVSGEGVQQALLKILEGTVASVPPQGGRKHPHQEFLSIDTTNILFICGGAFAGLDKIIAAADRQERGRLRREGALEALGGVGRAARRRDARGPPQLRADPRVHRPACRSSRPCTSCASEDLVQILVEPKNALVKQYQRFFGYDSIELVFTDDALWEIADKALERETGARGLRSIIENALLDVMFELPSRKDVSKCVITKETISKGLKPTLVTSAGSYADEVAADAAESA